MSVKTSKTGAGGGQTELFPRVVGEKQVMEAKQKADAAKGLDDATRKMLRHEEDLQKKMLIEREEENFSNLLALKCANGWLKIYNNSAMILSSWLDGRLGRPYHRADDNGFGAKAKYGVVSIPPDKVQELIQALDQANVKLSYDDEWVLEFWLGERISQEDMVRMLHEDELIIEKTNKLVMPKETMPNLRAAVLVISFNSVIKML